MKAVYVASFACLVGSAVVQPALAAEGAKGEKEVVYSFCSQPDCTDGAKPYSDLIDVNGTLYGTTIYGGASCTQTDGCCRQNGGCGTVFAVDPKTGTEKVVYSFCSQPNCADGDGPNGSLIDVGGTLYGTTVSGGTGAPTDGTVFELDPKTGTETVLYSFCSQPNCTDGDQPEAGVIAVNGTLYGTTWKGGAHIQGTVFALDLKTHAETVLYSFCAQPNCADGQVPAASLIDVKGTLYGTALRGPNGSGEVFSLDPKNRAETVVYPFCSQPNCTDGAEPFSGLIDVKGTLYGTTKIGGNTACNNGFGCGTVFAVNPNTRTETVPYDFCTQPLCTDGEETEAGLINVNGTLYGTTPSGGAEGHGTAFALDPTTTTETVLHFFCKQPNCTDGEEPWAAVANVKGMLYGTTAYGGAHGYGTVFAVKP